jgi:phosphoribosylglycinamide formyltransferase-1
MNQAVVLVSGRGSNLQAILDADLPLQVVAVLSNDPAAARAITRGPGWSAQRGDWRSKSADHG